MATSVHLTPELERFARKCVKSGRYNDVSDVVRSGLRLLREAEERRRQFAESLKEAEEEADPDVTHGAKATYSPRWMRIIEASKRWKARAILSPGARRELLALRVGSQRTTQQRRGPCARRSRRWRSASVSDPWRGGLRPDLIDTRFRFVALTNFPYIVV